MNVTTSRPRGAYNWGIGWEMRDGRDVNTYMDDEKLKYSDAIINNSNNY